MTQVTLWDLIRSTGLCGLAIIVLSLVLLAKGILLLGSRHERGSYVGYLVLACVPLLLGVVGSYMAKIRAQNLIAAMGGAATPADLARYMHVSWVVMAMGLISSLLFIGLGAAGMLIGGGPKRPPEPSDE